MIFMIVFISCFIVLILIIYLIFSRGKFRFRSMVKDILYGLSIGLPIIIASYLKWFIKIPVNPIYFILITLIVLLPYLGLKWLNIIKGRESIYQSLTFSIAIILFLLTFVLNPVIGIFLTIIGWIFLIFFFVDVYRYPYLHSSWLSAVIEETSGSIKNKGKFSGKPVIINIAFHTRFVTGILGLSLLIKPDKVIGRMTKSFHKKIGEPNLEEFFSKLIEKIQLYCK